MSQTWNADPLLTASDTLAASRAYINDALDALKSSFAGASAPTGAAGPIEGQIWCDSDDDLLKIYDGSAWRTIGDITVNYLGLLPRSAGASYPITGDLYFGDSKRIKQLVDPTDAQDAATKNYCDTTFVELAGDTMSGDLTMGANDVVIDHNPTADTHAARKAYVDSQATGGGTYSANIDMDDTYTVTGLAAPSAASDAATKSYVDGEFDTSTGHDHDGSAGHGKRVDVDDLATSSFSAGEALMVASGGFGFDKLGVKGDVDHYENNSYTGGVGWINGACSITFNVTKDSQKVLIYGTASHFGGDMRKLRVESDGANVKEIGGTGQACDSLTVCVADTVTSAGSTTFELDLYTNDGWINASLFVIEIE
jgi:hypothetical protein